jgi:hypothetical protein
MAVNSAGGTALLASNRLGTSFNGTSNFSIFSFSLLTCKENIVEAKPEPYENMPIRLPSKESAPVLNESNLVNFSVNLNGIFLCYLTRRDTNPPYNEGVYIFPTALASIRLGRVFVSKAALLHLTAACSNSRLK